MVAEAVREQPRREHRDDAEDIGRRRRPCAIRLNMLRFMVRNDFQPRTRNGQPDQRTTGVARTSSSQRAVRSPSQCADRQAEHRPHGDARAAARSAPRRPRSGGGSRRARGSVPRRRPARPSAPAPCRRSGSRRARSARSRDASGRCRSCPPASARAPAVPQVGLRLGLELRPCSGRAEVEPLAPVLRHMPRASRGRPSCRRPGRSPRCSRRARPRTSRGSPRSRSG